MICISVSPSSRTLAPVDLLNASRKCDLIELCLDQFIKTPDVAELLRSVDKPVLVSCRRQRDGGHWRHSEEQRLQLLRNSIVAGPAYIELELDVADKVPRFGNTRRVISYTSLNRPPAKIDDVFEKCWNAKADVVKFTWPTDDLDAAWPLLAAVTQKRELPVVGQGIGPSGLTFSLLSRKYGSPWIYAALEKGMETWPGQPTVWELEEEYRWNEIGRGTRFLGIIGMGAAENTSTRILNFSFQELGRRIRCLPLIPGKSDRLKKMLQVMKINGLIVDPMCSAHLDDFAEPGDEVARKSGYMDLFMEKSSGWKGVATLLSALETVIHNQREDLLRMNGRAVTVIGSGPLGMAAAVWAASKNAAVSIAAPSDNAATSAARHCGVRHLPWSAVHGVRTEILILAGCEIRCGTDRRELNPSLIREGMTVVDLTRYPNESAFADEAAARGAHYPSPPRIFAEQLQLQFRTLTGLDLPPGAFEKGLGPR
ncbi:MAG: type I 3-dehydroquinate dehydratase [Planctomycetaceae bacterium]